MSGKKEKYLHFYKNKKKKTSLFNVKTVNTDTSSGTEVWPNNLIIKSYNILCIVEKKKKIFYIKSILANLPVQI